MAFISNGHFSDTEKLEVTHSAQVNGRVYQLHFAVYTDPKQQSSFKVNIDAGDTMLADNEFTFYGRGVVSGTFPYVGEGTDASTVTITCNEGLAFSGNYLLLDGA